MNRSPAQSRLKVAYFANRADLTGGAGEIVRLLPLLRDHQVVMAFLSDPGPDALAIQHEGAMVHALGEPAASGFLSGVVTVQRLRRLFAAFAPDVVHGLGVAESALAAVAGRIAGVPVLVGSVFDHGGGAGSVLRRAALRRLDRIVVPTDALAREIAPYLGTRPAVSIVPSGVSPSLRGCARSPEWSEPRLRIGSMFAIEPGSGVDVLLDAAAIVRARFPEAEWLIAGTGADALATLRAIERRGLTGFVTLLGDREEPGPWLAALDAFASPGPRTAAPCGLLHALVAGVPCVAVRNPSIEATCVDGDDAILVAPDDPAALAAGVARILDDGASALRARLRRNADRHAERHSADAAAQMLLETYSELADSET